MQNANELNVVSGIRPETLQGHFVIYRFLTDIPKSNRSMGLFPLYFFFFENTGANAHHPAPIFETLKRLMGTAEVLLLRYIL